MVISDDVGHLEAVNGGGCCCWGVPTSSRVFASTKIQPISITSAESLVTYTPCSSQVVATWMTT